MRRVARVAIASALAGVALEALVASCTYTWDLPPEGDGSATDGKNGTPSDALTSAQDGATGGDAGMDVASDAFTGPACDSSATCGVNSVCVFNDHKCGAKEPGACQTMMALNDGSVGCSATTGGTNTGPAAVCGCNGVTYASSCGAYKSGIDLALAGCTAEAGLFQCGYDFCDPESSYCTQDPSDGTFKCTAWAACISKACSCVMKAVATCTCAEAGAGVVVTCN